MSCVNKFGKMQEEIIEAVRNYSILYDTNDPSYMKSKLKDEIWNTIAQSVNLKTGNETKQMWLKLRSCHREALRRQKNNFKSGSAATVIKTWRYQKQMDFLVPYMANRPREGNLEHESEEDQTQDLSENTDNAELELENVVPENLDTENFFGSSETPNENTQQFQNEDLQKASVTPKSVIKAPISKNKRTKKDDICSIVKESMIRRDKRAEERALERRQVIQETAKPECDGLHKFFLAMYELTKKMPAAYQHIIRNKVYEAVSEVEAEYLQINTYSRSSHSQHLSRQTDLQIPNLHHIQPLHRYSPQTSQTANSLSSPFHGSYSSVTSTPLPSPDEETRNSFEPNNAATFFHHYQAE